jgi:hypothetical protein
MRPGSRQIERRIREAVGELGVRGYVTDPEGNRAGLWQNA